MTPDDIVAKARAHIQKLDRWSKENGHVRTPDIPDIESFVRADVREAAVVYFTSDRSTGTLMIILDKETGKILNSCWQPLVSGT